MSVAPGVLEKFSVPPLDDTMGAMLIGVLISAALWGISCAQTYHYYTHYSDTWLLQTIVLTSFLLDTAHQGLVSHAIYTYLITWYSNPLGLLRIVWSLEAQVLVTAVNVLIVEMFYTWRVWHLGGQSILRVSPLAVLSLASFAAEIREQHLQSRLAPDSLHSVFYSKMRSCGSIFEISKLLDYAYILGAVGVSDIVAITVPTIYLLYSSRSVFTATNNIIQRLIVFSITTGLATSVCSIMSLVTTIALPQTLIFAALYILLSKLATNSLLMTLNMREGIRAALPNTVAIGSLRFASATIEQVTSSRRTVRYSSTCGASGVVHDLPEQSETVSDVSRTPRATDKECMV